MTIPKNKILISLTIISFFTITCCQNFPSKNDEINNILQENQILKTELSELKEDLENEQESIANSPLLLAIKIVILLEQQNFIELSDFVHTEKGVLFSPYTYVDLSNSIIFNRSEIMEIVSNSQIYTWGVFDGSGKPIEFNFEQYYNRFIFDQNYANPQIIGNNIEISQGNMINNIKDVFPNAYFIEFYFKSFDPQYEGIDWKSLKIVMEDLNGKWYLVGIIHGEWTI